jgi:Na+-transporting NADH:ubiquinone oxidoreductase subunit B
MGKKEKRSNPLSQAVNTFLYTPPGSTTKTAPHVRDAINTKRMMIIVVIALMPAVIMALYNTGLQANIVLAEKGAASVPGWRGSVLASLGVGINSENIVGNMVHGALYFLPVYIISLLAGLFWETVFASVRKRVLNEMVIVTTLLFSLILPPTIPWWQVVLGISFGTVIGKEIYGGFGRNLLNPALVGYAFLFFAYPAQITGDAVWVAVDGVTKATPLAELKIAHVSSTWMDSFIGLIPGAMGETSTLACLIGAAILIITGIGSWRIMLSILAGMVSLSLLFNAIGSDTNPMFQVTPPFSARRFCFWDCLHGHRSCYECYDTERSDLLWIPHRRINCPYQGSEPFIR